METLQAIAARRSIRKFTGQAVTRETVEAVLQAAIQAPSGKNRQPWRFVVVAGDEKRAQMIRVMRAGIEDTKARGMDTGTAIMTSMDAALGPTDVPGGS
jgi:nitroreductase